MAMFMFKRVCVLIAVCSRRRDLLTGKVSLPHYVHSICQSRLWATGHWAVREGICRGRQMPFAIHWQSKDWPMGSAADRKGKVGPYSTVFFNCKSFKKILIQPNLDNIV